MVICSRNNQSVRSFGTETRVEGHVIPPSEETFDFVCFRGQDIKDLHVHDHDEGPEQEVRAGLPGECKIFLIDRCLYNACGYACLLIQLSRAGTGSYRIYEGIAN